MNRLLKLTLLTIVALALYSCDIFTFAFMVNKTKTDIKVKIQYDRESLEEQLNPYEIERQMKYEASKGELISLDSINLTIEIRLKPNDSLEIDSNRGSRPYFKIIKSVTIFSNDTIFLDKENISKSFTETKDRIYIMEIK